MHGVLSRSCHGRPGARLAHAISRHTFRDIGAIRKALWRIALWLSLAYRSSMAPRGARVNQRDRSCCQVHETYQSQLGPRASAVCCRLPSSATRWPFAPVPIRCASHAGTPGQTFGISPISARGWLLGNPAIEEGKQSREEGVPFTHVTPRCCVWCPLFARAAAPLRGEPESRGYPTLGIPNSWVRVCLPEQHGCRPEGSA